MPGIVLEHRYEDDEVKSRFPGRWKPCTGSIFRDGAPSWKDIQQASLGNCYLLVALQALAQRNPEIIKKIIWENPKDQTVTVRLYQPIFSPDGSDVLLFQPIDYILDKSRYVGSKNNHKAPWVDLVEKAYALHRIAIDPEKYEKEQQYAAVLSGGNTRDSFWHLLGVDAKMNPILRRPRDIKFPFLVADVNYKDCCNDENSGEIMKPLIRQIFLGFKEERKLSGVFKSEEALDDFLEHFPYQNYRQFHDIILSDSSEEKETELKALLTGLKSDTVSRLIKYVNDFILQKTYKELYDRLTESEYVCAASNLKKREVSKNIVPEHAYHVFDVFEENGQRYVKMGNPWGKSVPKSPVITSPSNHAIRSSNSQQQEIDRSGGTFILKIEEFVSNFFLTFVTQIKQSTDEAAKEYEACVSDGSDVIDRVSLQSNDEAQIIEINTPEQIRESACSNLERLQDIKLLSTVDVSSDKQDAHVVVPALENPLNKYLAEFKQTEFSQENKLKQWSHRLFDRGGNRFISQKRQNRANTLLALTKVYTKLSDDDDKSRIVKMILAIKTQHDKDVSAVSRYHGNRLGKLLSELNELQVESPRKALSSKAGRVLQDALKEQGFEDYQQCSLVKSHAGELDLAIRRYIKPTITPQERVAPGDNSACMFSGLNKHRVSLFTEESVVTHQGFGSSFD